MRRRAGHPRPRERDGSTPTTRCHLRSPAAYTPLRHDAVNGRPRTSAVRWQRLRQPRPGGRYVPGTGQQAWPAPPRSRLVAQTLLHLSPLRPTRDAGRRRPSCTLPSAKSSRRCSRGRESASTPCPAPWSVSSAPASRVASASTASSAFAAMPAPATVWWLFLQGPRILPLVRRSPHGRHRGAPRGPCASRGAGSPMGALGPLRAALPPGLRRAEDERRALALRAHRLCVASPPRPPAVGHRSGPVRCGDLRAAVRRRPQRERPRPLARARRGLRARGRAVAALLAAPRTERCRRGACRRADGTKAVPAARA